MSQLLPCLKDMQATSWSLIVFWNESKGPIARRGPDAGLDFTDQPAPAPEQPPQPPAGEHVDYPGYDDPHGDMPLDDEDMPPPTSQQPEPDLDDDAIELHTGDDPLEMPLDSDEEAVHRGRDLAMGRHRMSRQFLWSIMMSHLVLEVLLVLLVRFLSLLIRIKCLVHLCRGWHLLHRLFLFLFRHTRTFRLHRV
eukprot:s1826_g11.t1